jgi:ribosomal protein S21
MPKRVRPWCTEHLGGAIFMTIQYKNKAIEFKQDKNAIELPSKGELEPTLRNIKKAVDNGEFDRLLQEKLAYDSRLTKQKSKQIRAHFRHLNL